MIWSTDNVVGVSPKAVCRAVWMLPLFPHCCIPWSPGIAVEYNMILNITQREVFLLKLCSDNKPRKRHHIHRPSAQVMEIFLSSLETRYREMSREHYSIDGLAQDCSNSIANALELLQSCTKPLVCWTTLTNVDKRCQHRLECVYMCIYQHRSILWRHPCHI